MKNEREGVFVIQYKNFNGFKPYVSTKKDYDKQQIYDRSIPYKFYDTEAFADYLNSVFVV